MPVSEARINIILTDNASRGLQSLTNTYNKFSNTIQNSGNKLAQFNKQINGSTLNGVAKNADQAANSLSNMNKMMERIVYSASRYFVIYKAMGAVGDVWDTIVGGSYEYAKSLETNQIGIAGILTSMITLNGEQIKWNDAMAMSGKAMKGLQSEALRTAATSKELIETFRALLGPGLSSGMTLDQIVKLSTVGTNAVRSLGLPTNQYVQELRSIITEGIRPASSTLATSLGITNKDVKAAKASADGLYNYLMKRMTGFADAVKYTSGTVEGRIARIQEGLQVAGAKGSEELYKSFSKVLEEIANYLIPIPEKLGDKWEINPEFVKSIKEISERVGKIVENIGDFGKTISPLFGVGFGTVLTVIGQLADKIQIIAGYFLATKIAPFLADLGNLVVQSRYAYEAQTALGRALQGVSDKIKGRTAAQKQLSIDQQKAIEIEKAYNEELNRTVAIIKQQRALDNPKKLPTWKADTWKMSELNKLVEKMRQLGAEEDRVNAIGRRFFNYLKNGTQEGARDIRQLIILEEKEYQTKLKQINAQADWNAKIQVTSERVSALLSGFGSLAIAGSVLSNVIAQVDEENREFYESAGNAAMTAGMFAMAISSITSAIPGMIDGLSKGIAWLNKFATARALAGLGVAGSIALGIAGVVKHAYNEYNETGVASSIDDWTGEKISRDFGHSFGNPQEMRDIDDADSYAIIDTSKSEVGLLNPPSVGGGSKGGGSSRANKAEEYAARMKKLVEDLNKEITNMSNTATAYEKTMAAGTDKLASQEKDIVKAMQLGVDVGEVRKKQEEYLVALKKKAVVAQEDENLKYMKLEEEQANRISVMGYGSVEEQRKVLTEKLENHKAYLNELLAGDIENKERRYQLEAELASVTKQIRENSVYEFKTGWAEALDELANRQINFKDAFVSAFDSIEGSLVSLVSETGSASEKFKKFCQDVTNMILKSMTQIIVKGLITKAIMAAIGFSTSSSSSYTQADVAKMSNMIAMSDGVRASGGSVSAGGTYLVGENGPELLQMGNSNGRVYSRSQTQNMLGGGIENIKVELINKSNNQMKVTQGSTKIDAKTMVISLMMEGIGTNTMGSRDFLKGLAST